MGAIGWIAAGFSIVISVWAVCLWLNRRLTLKKRNGYQGDSRGGEMGDLNRLLQEGAISPEEYELLKRRILAGQVY